MMFGGRVAEEIIFGKENVTSGASNDILQATQKARAMVVEWGMSEILGPLKYSENEEDVFLGRSVTQRTSMSDETAKLIDKEIRKLIDNAENHAKKVLKKNIKHLHNLAKALLEFETMSGDEVRELIKKGKFKTKNTSSKSDINKKTSLPTSGGSKNKTKGQIELDPNPATT